MCNNIQCETDDCKTMIYNSNATLYRAGGTGFTKVSDHYVRTDRWTADKPEDILPDLY